MKQKQKQRDPNSHLLTALRRSGAMGAHQKSKKALRRKEKVALKKGYQ
jgi:hypothetical protein